MVTAIIVAAGKGTRMREAQRKQYLLLAGLPILTRTLMVFDKCAEIKQVILVIPPDDFSYCRKNILNPAGLSKKVILAPGGQRRQESVLNGLKAVDPGCSIAVIHDGVRPFLRNSQLLACIDGAKESGACILGVPAYETLKQANASEHIIQTLERDDIWLAQTPQAFRYDLIRKAHDRASKEGYSATDDASLVERLGGTVKIIAGSRNNIKITIQEDFEMARRLYPRDGFK
jgi:2-C-methyl-D-erythritol 4-phosphate cytidylyltransferase